jgi:hypothetical protein
MAYAQLTWREFLRDIEATRGANATRLCSMGLRQAVRCSTLADANERARLKEIQVHTGSLGDGFVPSGLMRLQRFRTAQE